MKVVLDARKYRDGGIGSYIRTLIKGILEFTDIELHIIVNKEVKDLNHKRLTKHVSKIRKYSIREYFLLSRLVNKIDPDIFHSPHYTLPFNIKAKKIITIHDLIHIIAPSKSYYPVIAKMLIKSATLRASKVVAISKSCYEDLLSSNLVKKENLIICSNSFNSEILLEGKRPHSLKLNKYFLSVISTNKKHKGIEDLIKVFKEIPENLVLIGYGVEDYKNQTKDNICILGKVTKEELSYLYKNMRALIVPSIKEGFCLPLLEAHAYRKAVLGRPDAAILENKADFDLIAKDFSLDSLKETIKTYSVKETTIQENINSFNFDQYFKNYDLETNIKKLESIYRDIL